MQSTDGQPLQSALPGQYVVVRLATDVPAAGHCFAATRSRVPQSTERYRVSVKIEPNGAAGTYLHEHVRVGDALDVSAPRGSFILQSGDRPIVLLSAGIGATPVLAMLHALAATRSTRPVWWLHSARDGQHHPFAAEVRRLMLALPHGHSYVCYSRPDSGDTMAEDFDATGHLSRSVFEALGVPRDADVYICGPTRFMAEMKEALATLGVAPERMHVEIFNGSESMMPGVVGAAPRAPHLPEDDADTGPLVSFARSGIAAHWKRVVLPEHSGVGRSVRRPGPVVVPDRCVSQLRERSGLGRGRLRTGAARQARRRQSARVLLTTASRHRHRFVTFGRTWRRSAVACVDLEDLQSTMSWESIGIIPTGYSRHSLEDQRK